MRCALAILRWPLPFTECALVGVDETGTTGSTSVDGTPLGRELGYPRLVSYVPGDAPIVYSLPNGPRELRDGGALLEVGAGRGRACGEVPHSRLSGQAHEAPVARHEAAGDARRGIPDRRALTDRGTGALMSSNILRTSMSWLTTCSSSRTAYWPIAHTATVTSERSAKTVRITEKRLFHHKLPSNGGGHEGNREEALLERERALPLLQGILPRKGDRRELSRAARILRLFLRPRLERQRRPARLPKRARSPNSWTRC